MGRTGSKEHRARARLYKLIECIISLHGQTECFGLLFQFFFSFSLLLGFGELSHSIEPSYLRIHSAKQSRLRQTECSHRKDVDKKLNEWSNVHCTSHPALSACWHISRFFFVMDTTARTLCSTNHMFKYQYRFCITCMRPQSKQQQKSVLQMRNNQRMNKWTIQLHLGFCIWRMHCYESATNPFCIRLFGKIHFELIAQWKTIKWTLLLTSHFSPLKDICARRFCATHSSGERKN